MCRSKVGGARVHHVHQLHVCAYRQRQAHGLQLGNESTAVTGVIISGYAFNSSANIEFSGCSTSQNFVSVSCFCADCTIDCATPPPPAGPACSWCRLNPSSLLPHTPSPRRHTKSAAAHSDALAALRTRSTPPATPPRPVPQPAPPHILTVDGQSNAPPVSRIMPEAPLIFFSHARCLSDTGPCRYQHTRSRARQIAMALARRAGSPPPPDPRPAPASSAREPAAMHGCRGVRSGSAVSAMVMAHARIHGQLVRSLITQPQQILCRRDHRLSEETNRDTAHNPRHPPFAQVLHAFLALRHPECHFRGRRPGPQSSVASTSSFHCGVLPCASRTVFRRRSLPRVRCFYGKQGGA